MSTVITYLIIAAVLIVAELVYFKIADKFNIIDKPNQRSSHSRIGSHSRIVLRGGGIIFTIARGYGVYGVGFNIRGCWQV